MRAGFPWILLYRMSTEMQREERSLSLSDTNPSCQRRHAASLPHVLVDRRQGTKGVGCVATQITEKMDSSITSNHFCSLHSPIVITTITVSSGASRSARCCMESSRAPPVVPTAPTSPTCSSGVWSSSSPPSSCLPSSRSSRQAAISPQR